MHYFPISKIYHSIYCCLLLLILSHYYYYWYHFCVHYYHLVLFILLAKKIFSISRLTINQLNCFIIVSSSLNYKKIYFIKVSNKFQNYSRINQSIIFVRIWTIFQFILLSLALYQLPCSFLFPLLFLIMMMLLLNSCHICLSLWKITLFINWDWWA